jgi:ubiquinone/menaquinone biosynthesis C-methylase UbiE
VSNELKYKVRSQFGASADAYATSHVHANGESLTLLSALIAPQPTWQVLDVGSGAGHTAFIFSPHVSRVVVLDMTEEMVAKAVTLAATRGLRNIYATVADAEHLPFDNASFDLVTCRLAYHHFPTPDKALTEFARVLKPHGVLGFTDNITVPDEEEATYYNTFEQLRDPSHNWAYSLTHLLKNIEQAGFQVGATRKFRKEFEFQEWADRQHVSDHDKEQLLKMMKHIPLRLKQLMAPRWVDGTLYFQLQEMVLVATKR